MPVEASVAVAEMVETGVAAAAELVIRVLTIHHRPRRGLGFWVFF
jgi:hypothetical protein